MAGQHAHPESLPIIRVIARATRAAPRSADAVETPKPPTSASAATPNGARSLLVMEADALVDAYALVLKRALTTYQGRIKPDEVRWLLLSAHIQRRQLSTCA